MLFYVLTEPENKINSAGEGHQWFAWAYKWSNTTQK
jgi:hypothetical protein